MQQNNPFQINYRPYPDPDGLLEIAPIPWDSQLFGFPVYELKIDHTPELLLAHHLPGLISSFSDENTLLIGVKIPPRAIEKGQILSANGFYLIETQLELYLNLNQLRILSDRPYPHLEIVRAEAKDLSRVREIAASAFYADRFHLDPNLPSESADKRYQYWVDQGFSSGEPIFISRDIHNLAISGFLHSREMPLKLVDLMLAAVDRTSQSTGIGLNLYQEVLSRFRQMGYEIARTRVSIHNLPMLNLLMKLNFKITSINVTYHYFYGPTRSKHSQE